MLYLSIGRARSGFAHGAAWSSLLTTSMYLGSPVASNPSRPMGRPEAVKFRDLTKLSAVWVMMASVLGQL